MNKHVKAINKHVKWKIFEKNFRKRNDLLNNRDLPDFFSIIIGKECIELKIREKPKFRFFSPVKIEEIKKFAREYNKSAKKLGLKI
jgi:ribosomal protein L16 Arg81 hydroxylase